MKSLSKKKRIITVLAIVACAFVAVCGAAVLGINAYVKGSVSDRIMTVEEASKLSDVDCVLVLGCGVHGDVPSHMLEDRLLKALEVYDTGVTEKILMTGDHGRENYDEVNVMKDFAKEKGVKDDDIFMDHAGFSTYDSMYRSDYIFGCKKVIIITQKYHLYRALYIAEKLGIEAYGVNSDQRTYGKFIYREIREILARDKDLVKCIIKPEPVCLGEKIPISGSGALTNDKTEVYKAYSKADDGTWLCEGKAYKYRLEITGRMNNAAKDTTFVYLSNIEEISFEEAWKAAGFSSDTEDYFSADTAVLVEMR